MDDVLLKTSTSEGTFNPGDAGGVENEEDTESDAGPIWEPRVNGLEIVLFFELEPILFELEPIPTEPEYGGSNSEGPGEDDEEDPQFRAYSHLNYMHNVNLSACSSVHFDHMSFVDEVYKL